MLSKVENLIYVEVGSRCVWEADVRDRRVRVECVYEVRSLSWAYDVFVIEAGGPRRLTDRPTSRRNFTQGGAVIEGMQMGGDAILGV